MTPYCIVLCTCPDAAMAEGLARQLTEAKLVACTNIVPHITSIYFWKEKVEQGTEVMLVMKTKQDVLSDLEAAIRKVHPYSVFEFLALPIIYGNSQYLQWVEETVSSNHDKL